MKLDFKLSLFPYGNELSSLILIEFYEHSIDRTLCYEINEFLGFDKLILNLSITSKIIAITAKRVKRVTLSKLGTPLIRGAPSLLATTSQFLEVSARPN